MTCMSVRFLFAAFREVLRPSSRKNNNCSPFWNDLCPAWKEGNVLFNDALNTFYLRLYGVRHMVKDNSDSEGRKLAAATWATLSD